MKSAAYALLLATVAAGYAFPAPSEPGPATPAKEATPRRDARLKLGVFADPFGGTGTDALGGRGNIPRFESTIDVHAEPKLDLDATMAEWWKHWDFPPYHGPQGAQAIYENARHRPYNPQSANIGALLQQLLSRFLTDKPLNKKD